MPGVVGIVTKLPRELAEQELLRMVRALRHESFYETGTWGDETLGVYVGWAAHKNSFAESMPLYNERGDVVLVFSGEEYAHSPRSRQAKEQGKEIQTKRRDYLVDLYEEQPTFPASLNGRFHGLIADRTRGIATLFNDRYGMHRMYYHAGNGSFYFAAEAKAILAVRPELRRADTRGLGELVGCGCVLENRTIFEGIHVLPSGSSWVFANGALKRKHTYFQPEEWENQERLEPQPYYKELRDTFSRILPRYLNGQQRIGMSLTGGLDTRAVMAWQKFDPGSLPCYTFGGMFRDCRDVVVARQVARACGQPHEVIRVTSEFLSHFPRYAERSVYLTDGCVDVSRSPDLYVSERAREIAPVRLTGLYGDEVLRQLPAFKPVKPSAELFRAEFLSHIYAARETYEKLLREHPVSFAVFRQAPWHHYGILALEGTQLAVRTPFLDNDFVRTVFRAPRSASINNKLRLQLIGDGNPALLDIRTDRGFGGPGHLSATISRWLLEFTFKAEYAYDYGMPQWMARIDHFFRRLHPEDLFLGRHKLFHFRIWYRDALSDYVQQVLLDPRALSRPYLERRTVEAVVRAHVKGDRNYTTEIHKMLTLELLQQVFFESK